MRVGKADINVRDLVNQIKARNMPKSKRVRTPNCTHVDMDRVYGRDQQCYVCGREPSIGFLYECKQDCDTQSLHDLLEHEDDDPREVAKSDMRLQLEWVGLSESVIRTAEQGHYTQAQLEKLKGQKQELRLIISDAIQANQINNAVFKLAAMEHMPPNNDGAGLSIGRDGGPPSCTFKACHTCRPYYRDRVYISFQSVFDADFAPVTLYDSVTLPTKSSHIMKSIGNTVSPYATPSSDDTPMNLPTSPSLATSTDAPPTASTSTSSSSDLTFKTTQTDLDEISAQRRPRRRFYKIGHRTSGDIARDLDRQPTRLSRNGLKTAVQNIFRPGRESSSEGSNITLPLPRTGTVRNSNNSKDVGEFDLPALRKVRKEKERSDVKNGTFVAGFEGVQAEYPSTLSSSPMAGIYILPEKKHHASSSASSDRSFVSASEGSEVEVDGGVALTEEAVEMHTPDILALDVVVKKVRDSELADISDDEGTGAGADMGLQSIMAQV